ncbi:MAG TPA: hypothetical protein VF141_16965, partial [Chryseolinea sp.]
MKRYKPIFAVFIFLMTVLSFWSWKTFESAQPVAAGYPTASSSPVTWCGSNIIFNAMDSSLASAKLLPGLGNLHYPVTTTSLDAQKFFEQGLRLIYAFNHWEAIQAFREAIRLDPDCAMAYWGMALAFGPNLNDWMPKDRERIALEFIEMAKARKARVSQVEKDLIDALASRYDGKAYELRDSLNLAYAQAMQAIVSKYPEDAEVQTL